MSPLVIFFVGLVVTLFVGTAFTLVAFGIAVDAKAQRQRDLELSGQRIREDDKVVMFYVSGNRDEEAFSDPDRLVLDRSEPRILSFGSGIHHCIGFRLARMQLQYLWEGMLDRFTGFELVDRPVHIRSNFVQGFKSMQVVARA